MKYIIASRQLEANKDGYVVLFLWIEDGKYQIGQMYNPDEIPRKEIAGRSFDIDVENDIDAKVCFDCWELK